MATKKILEQMKNEENLRSFGGKSFLFMYLCTFTN